MCRVCSTKLWEHRDNLDLVSSLGKRGGRHGNPSVIYIVIYTHTQLITHSLPLVSSTHSQQASNPLRHYCYPNPNPLRNPTLTTIPTTSSRHIQGSILHSHWTQVLKSNRHGQLLLSFFLGFCNNKLSFSFTESQDSFQSSLLFCWSVCKGWSTLGAGWLPSPAHDHSLPTFPCGPMATNAIHVLIIPSAYLQPRSLPQVQSLGIQLAHWYLHLDL